MNTAKLGGDVTTAGKALLTAADAAAQRSALTLGSVALLNSVSLTANVSGTLAVANGGTGVTTLTGIIKGNGTTAFTAAVAGTDFVAPAALSAYAPLASPTLTGTPAAPTAAQNTNTTQLATTAFVIGQGNSTAATIAMNGTQAAGTSTLFARADHVHPVDTSRAPLASPALSGTPTAPTAAFTTDSTQIATTAFAQEMRRQIVRNAQTGTTYTLVATDAGRAITLSNAAAVTVTIPASVFTAEDRVDFVQYGAGQVTFAAGAGFTLRSSGSKLKLAGQYSGATIYFISATEGVIIGDIVA